MAYCNGKAEQSGVVTGVAKANWVMPRRDSFCNGKVKLSIVK